MDTLGALGGEWEPSERSFLNLLKGALEYSVSTEARATKIANDVLHFYMDNTPEGEVGGMLFELWGVWIEVAYRIPHGHEWHRCMALAVDLIRQDQRASDRGSKEHDELPELFMSVRERWEYKPFGGAAHDHGEWKNLNSFMSLVVGSGFVQQIHLPLWEISLALEEPSSKELALMDYRVWVAAEWIINCREVLKGEMRKPDEELTVESREILGIGTLCDDSIKPRSWQRWEFWGRQLAEILEESDDIGLEEETKKHVEKALEVVRSTW